MKKKVVISVAALVMLVIIALFMPYSVKSYDDGGTVEIKTLACKIIKWNRFYEDDLCYNSTKVYWGKDKKKNIEIIWDEIVMNDPIDIDVDIENGVSPHFDAKVLEISESTILVEPLEGSSELNSSDKIIVPKIADNMMISYNCFDEIKAGDIVNIVYDGEIMETYPAQINPVFAITIKEKCGEAEETSAVTKSDTDEKVTTSRAYNPNEYETAVGYTSSVQKPETTTIVVGDPKRDNCYSETRTYSSVVYTVDDCDCLDVYSFRADVLDIDKNKLSFLVEGKSDNYHSKYDIYADVSKWDIAPGDEVVIYFDGMVEETYPAMIHGVHRVTVNHY